MNLRREAWMRYRPSPPRWSMLILFDNGVPAPLRHAITGHMVVEAIERGWDRLLNGELIAAAEAAGFEILLVTANLIRFVTKSPHLRYGGRRRSRSDDRDSKPEP